MGSKSTGRALHKLRVNLYRSNLPRAKGLWFARTAANRVMGIDEVADSLKTQGLSTANYNAMITHVKQYFDAMAELLCEGCTIDTGYFTIHPTVKGSFKTGHEAFDPKRHSVTFNFQPGVPLRQLAQLTEVKVERGKSQGGAILSFIDTSSETTNKWLTPGGGIHYGRPSYQDRRRQGGQWNVVCFNDGLAAVQGDKDPYWKHGRYNYQFCSGFASREVYNRDQNPV